MLTRLLHLVGLPLLVIEVLAKLPYAMCTVAVMTSVSAVRGSMSEAGATAALVGLGTALSGPLFGAAADRWGQRPVLLVSAVANALAMGALALVLRTETLGVEVPVTTVMLCGFLIGASAPQASSMVRARWLHILRARIEARDERERATSTVLSYQSMTDEICFVFGPVLTGLFASLVGIVVPLYVAALLTAGAVVAYALHPTYVYARGRTLARESAQAAPGPVPTTHAEAPSPSDQPAVPGGSVGTPGGLSAADDVPESADPLERIHPDPVRELFRARVLLPILGMVTIGYFFGSLLASLTGYMEARGSGDSTGLLYGILGIGSATCAMLVPLLPLRFGMSARWIVFAGLMVLGAVPTVTADPSLTFLVVSLLIGGCGVGPALVTMFSIASRVAPFGRTTTVMASMSTGLVVGQAISSWLTGTAIDLFGPHTGFVVTLGATICLVLFGVVRWLLAGTTAELRAERRAAARRAAHRSGGHPTMGADGSKY
ncbi:MFS transporter [Brevibacterium litoralis]|uniref:MFS transporter n=1 Tax=Brevibacterium litoralis TaxID=3138935 RepID=UPI0032ED05E7